jgi:choline dehydrogenase-like flavoprotein
MAANTYDAIVIGSGITGGWAAKELTEKGLNTLVLEAGRTTVPERDYVEHVPVWELKYRGWDDHVTRMKTQPIQRECYYACDEYSNKFFVSDVDNPYTCEEGKHFAWIRGRQVGGKSLTWGRQSYRWSDLDFEANLKDGVAVADPVCGYRTLVRLRRRIRRHQRTGRGIAATAGRKISAADGNDVRRARRPRSDGETFR